MNLDARQATELQRARICMRSIVQSGDALSASRARCALTYMARADRIRDERISIAAQLVAAGRHAVRAIAGAIEQLLTGRKQRTADVVKGGPL